MTALNKRPKRSDMTRNPMLIFGIVLFAIFAIGLIIVTAIDSGTLLTLIAGIVIVCGIGAALTAFGMRMYERRTEARVKVLELQNGFTLAMAKEGYTLPGSGWIRASHQIAAPQAVKPDPVIDPRHDLLVSLCLLTIRADGYGPNSERLLTADDAQSRGGKFADRNNWASASEYGQSIGLLYTKIGGKDQGLKVNGAGAGGRTVADLLDALHSRDVITDSAVIALPGVVR